MRASSLARVLFPQAEYPSTAIVIFTGGWSISLNEYRKNKKSCEKYHKTFVFPCYRVASIFILIEEEVILARVIRPDILDIFIDFTFVFHLLKVFEDFQGST